MSKLNNYLQSLSKRRGLLIIITAALLLELMSAAQYYYTHRIMEEELEKRAEGELTLKAILIKSTLNRSEDVLRSHLWDISRSLPNPDSVYLAVTRMVLHNRVVKGGGIGFVPGYFPSKGRLYELYSTWYDEEGKKAITQQIASESHDYTKSVFWEKALAAGDYVWVDPYIDNEGAGGLVTSYVRAVSDRSGALAGVAAVDVSLEWLRDTIDNRHLYPSSFVLLLTEDGKPIVQPEESRVSKATSEFVIGLVNDSTVARHKSRSGRSTVIHFDTDGRDGSVHYANMRGVPHWQLAVVCYDDEVFSSLTRLRYRLLLLSLLAFGILLYMIYRFARDERKLQRKTMEEERISGELRIASGIQQTLLPENESLARVDDVVVEGSLIPAKAVGGDLYNAFVRDDKLFFCIGDVSGKGIPSALIMAIVQSLFRNIASHENNPAHIMTQLNEMACRNNKSNIFVTMFVGVLDLPTGHLRYCNGGHEIPILISRRKDASGLSTPKIECQMLDAKANLPIGLFDDFKYEMQEMTMEKGSTLFLYTDGLTEARDVQNKQYGINRVLQMISDADTTNPKQIVETTIAQLKHFSVGTEQRDDLTMLVFNYTPTEEHYLLDEELTLRNDVKEVATLSTFVKSVMGRLHIGKELAYQLRLALEEAVVNVMEYAYPAGIAGDVHIRVTSDGRRLKFIITDSGIAFNPTEASQADTTLSVEERPVGGLGILLVRELMDSINYERTDGKNVLTLRKDYKEKMKD